MKEITTSKTTSAKGYCVMVRIVDGKDSIVRGYLSMAEYARVITGEAHIPLQRTPPGF